MWTASQPKAIIYIVKILSKIYVCKRRTVMEEKITSMIRVRMSAKDAHYGGNLVDGAHMVHLFGDVATELLIKCDGDEGLFCAYDNVEFLAPTYAGDYIEAVGEITDVGASAADFLEEPIVVARATGTCVTPKESKRK